MKMFLNYSGVWKSGTYAVVPAEIYDEKALKATMFAPAAKATLA